MKKYQSISSQLSLSELGKIDFGSDVFLIHKNSTNYSIGWGVQDKLSISSEKVLEQIDSFVEKHSGEYIFTALSYDLKNEIFPFLSSTNKDSLNFPLAELIICKNVLLVKDDSIKYYGIMSGLDVESFLENRLNGQIDFLHADFDEFISLEHYQEQFEKIIEDIQYGNIYEMNYCVDFSGKIETNHHFKIGLELLERTHATHGVIWSSSSHFIACNSPERFLNKKGCKLTTQPIKGTIKRGATNEEDEMLKEHLKTDLKERSENIMIVDLVRNDLSKIAKKNSVTVEELCEVYSFKTVNQLISTVSCELKENCSIGNILKATFPMGSMTGAPKISAMKIAEELETFTRGIYSGSIGIIEPNGDFDLNVVIRSLIMNKGSGKFKIPVGGAITIKAKAQNEYEECLLKLDAIKKILC